MAAIIIDSFGITERMNKKIVASKKHTVIKGASLNFFITNLPTNNPMAINSQNSEANSPDRAMLNFKYC